MRAISIIFRRELASYLRSPIGYVVAALLLFVCGLLFQGTALGGKERLSAEVLAIFFNWCSGATGVTAWVLAIRLLAEERQNQTIVLLNTSPVRDWEVVIGKYLAALTFLTIITLLSFYMPLLIKVRGKISFSQVAVGYLGMLLLGSAVLSIGIFASSLTKHQLVAGAVGAAIAIMMHIMYFLADKVDPPLKEVILGLSLWYPHFAESFMKGIFNLKDVVYYVAVTYFFLLLAIKTTEAKRWH